MVMSGIRRIDDEPLMKFKARIPSGALVRSMKTKRGLSMPGAVMLSISRTRLGRLPPSRAECPAAATRTFPHPELKHTPESCATLVITFP